MEVENPSMDTLKADLANGRIGGVIMFTWSDNLNNPAQIANLTHELQGSAPLPLLIATDEEGGKVARLSQYNGFSATPTAYTMGTGVNLESYTRSIASMMAGWFVQTGLNMNLAPVVDVNVNPSSPAIGALGRSFSADPYTVVNHASWFIDEFHKQNLVTALKHFPGHGSATADSHLGFTDVTTTWTPQELIPYQQLIGAGAVDVIMTAHVFNATIDSVYPATLSAPTVTGILRNQLGYQGVVVSDEMSMNAIANYYGLDEAMELAVRAGVDILLYNKNLDSTGNSLARRVIDVLEQSVLTGAISEARIDSSYDRIMALKSRITTGIAVRTGAPVPTSFSLSNYPNPFNPSTQIEYTVGGVRDQGLGVGNPIKNSEFLIHNSPEGQVSMVRLGVYDILGREVAVLVNEPQPPGTYTVRFDARSLASGVYLARIEAGGFSTTRKLMLLR